MAGVYSRVARHTTTMGEFWKASGAPDFLKRLEYKGLDIRGSNFEKSAKMEISKAFQEISKLVDKLPMKAKEPQLIARLQAVLKDQEAAMLEYILSIPAQDVYQKTHCGLPEKVPAVAGAVSEPVNW